MEFWPYFLVFCDFGLYSFRLPYQAPIIIVQQLSLLKAIFCMSQDHKSQQLSKFAISKFKPYPNYQFKTSSLYGNSLQFKLLMWNYNFVAKKRKNENILKSSLLQIYFACLVSFSLFDLIYFFQFLFANNAALFFLLNKKQIQKKLIYQKKEEGK